MAVGFIGIAFILAAKFVGRAIKELILMPGNHPRVYISYTILIFIILTPAPTFTLIQQ